MRVKRREKKTTNTSGTKCTMRGPSPPLLPFVPTHVRGYLRRKKRKGK
jgi:hypothetical protein